MIGEDILKILGFKEKLEKMIQERQTKGETGISIEVRTEIKVLEEVLEEFNRLLVRTWTLPNR